MSKKKTTTILVGLAALAALFGFAGKAKADDEDDDLRPDDDEDDDDTGIKVIPAVPGGPEFPPLTPIPAFPVDDPVKIVNRYLGPGDRDGSLYQIVSGDQPELIAKRVLHNVVPQDTTHTLVAPYVGQMAIHSYNLALYSCLWKPDDPNAPASNSRPGHSGRPSRPVTQRYTAKEYDPEGVMRRWYIGDAFFSRKHIDNLVQLRGGNDPLRTTDEEGRILEQGNSYGLIWLPKITGHRIGMHASVGVEPDLPPDLAALMPNIYGG